MIEINKIFDPKVWTEAIAKHLSNGMRTNFYASAEEFLPMVEAGQLSCMPFAGGVYYLLEKEKQFVIGIPAREMGDWDSGERILIQGIIDAFFEEDGALVLVDYKTDYVTEGEILKKRYRTQLEYYRRALEQITGSKVKESYLYSFRAGVVPMD